ncbi:MAG: carboxypeptidase-like regulatory domain-containing protein [Nannocystaceae bacterium]
MIDKDRAPVTDAQVSLKPSILDARYETTSTTANSLGQFEFRQLEPGIYRPFVDGGNYRLIGDPPVVQVGYGGVSDPVELVVESGHRLTVGVRDEHGMCVGPGAALVIDREDSPIHAHPVGGGLELSAVPTGGHLLRCSCLNGLVRELRVEVSADSVAVCDFGFGSTVEGQVLGDAGQAVSGASVNVVGRELYAITDEDGSFVLGGLPAEDLSLRVYAPGFRPSRAQRFRVEDDQRITGVEFVLDEGACVEGTVELLVEGNEELILASRMHGNIRLARGTRGFRACGFVAGASEAFSVNGPLGPLPVSRSRSGPFAGSITLSTEDPIRSTTIVVDNRHFRLRGTVQASGEPVEGASVVAMRVAEGMRQCFRARLGAAASAATHADGEFLFDLLPAGRWMIAAQGPEGEDGCIFLEVDEDSDVRIDVGPAVP